MASHVESMGNRKRAQDAANRPSDDGARAVRRKAAATPLGQARLEEQLRWRIMWAALLARRMQVLIALEGLDEPPYTSEAMKAIADSDDFQRFSHFHECWRGMRSDVARLMGKILYDSRGVHADGTARWEEVVSDAADDFVQLQPPGKFSTFGIWWLQGFEVSEWDELLEKPLAPGDASTLLGKQPRNYRLDGKWACPYNGHKIFHPDGFKCCHDFKAACDRVTGSRIHAWASAQGQPLNDEQEQAEWAHVDRWIEGECEEAFV